MILFISTFFAIFISALIISSAYAIDQRKERERLKWKAFALCLSAMQRFERRALEDAVIEAVILATKKAPGPPPPQLKALVYKRPDAISPKAMEHLPHEGLPKRLSKPR